MAIDDIGLSFYFSVEIRPRTNQRCITITTMSGGAMMMSVPAMATFQSGKPNSEGMRCFSCVTAMPKFGSVVMSKGQRYWFHDQTNMMVNSAIMLGLDSGNRMSTKKRT